MPKNKKKILIVDDALFLRVKLKEIINKTDFAEVIGEAINGKEAISLYKELQPDLVTMDLVMPVMGGIEAIEEIMKINNNAKIIVISAYGQRDKIEKATAKGALDFIHKPFKEERVIRVIRNILLS
ncbi:MAG: response regulator [Promethearchaeota archaeon]